MWKNMKKRVEIILKLATIRQSDKGFLLTSTFVPKGLSAPALGLYTCIKTLKYIPGPGVRWAFTGPLVLWLHDAADIETSIILIAKYLGLLHVYNLVDIIVFNKEKTDFFTTPSSALSLHAHFQTISKDKSTAFFKYTGTGLSTT